MFKSLAHDIDNQHRTNDVYISENVDFTGMLLSQSVLEGLQSAGFKKPSPIQLKSIPLGLCGFDLIIQSKSGTGKTVVFSILALESISLNIKSPQVLILTPTREIAVQIQHVLRTVGAHLKDFNAEHFIGGLPVEQDIENLTKKSVHIAIGAPGRIKSLIENKHLKTKNIKLFVLDEADKLMLDSFKDDINFINSQLPQTKQIIATSATYRDALDRVVAEYMKSPKKISVETDIPTLLGLKQFVCLTTKHLNIVRQIQFKTNELTRILSSVPFKQCIVFTNYQTRAESLCNNLNNMGWPATFISASQSQEERLKALKKLKNHNCRLLISTDLIARGIDAENVNLVINYDVPYDAATYMHRIGRAGRYGSLGLCITICNNGDEYAKFKSLLSTISINIELLILPSEIPPNFWQCDNNRFEKIAFSDANKIAKNNPIQNKENTSYEIQSDNILKIADLENKTSNVLKENNSAPPNSKVSTGIITEVSNSIQYSPSKTNGSTITSENFGTPMPKDLSTTPKVLAEERKKQSILEKNIALVTISKLLVNENENLNFEPFIHFQKLILSRKIQNSQIEDFVRNRESQNTIENPTLLDCHHIEVNEIEKTQSESNKSVSKFKSFAELKASLDNCPKNRIEKSDLEENIYDKSKLENGEIIPRVETKEFKSFAEFKSLLNQDSDSKIIQSGLNEQLSKESANNVKSYQSTNSNIETNEVEKTRNESNKSVSKFKSFAELKASLDNCPKSNTEKSDLEENNYDKSKSENGEIIPRVETKGFKSFAELKSLINHGSDSKIIQSSSNKQLSKESVAENTSKTNNLQSSECLNTNIEVNEIEKTRNESNKSISNFKSFAELKASLNNCPKNRIETSTSCDKSESENGEVIQRVDTKGFKSFAELSSLINHKTSEEPVSENTSTTNDSNSFECLQVKQKLLGDPISEIEKTNFQSIEAINSLVNRDKTIEVEVSESEVKNSGLEKFVDSSREIEANVHDQNVSHQNETTDDINVNITKLREPIKSTKIDDYVISKVDYLLLLLQCDKETYATNKKKWKQVNYKILLDALLNNKPLNLNTLTKTEDSVRIIESKVVIDSKSDNKRFSKESKPKSMEIPQIKNITHSSKNGYSSISDERYVNSFQKSDGVPYDHVEYDLNVSSKLPSGRCNTDENYNNRLQESIYYQTVSHVYSTGYSDNYCDSWYKMWREQVRHIQNYVQLAGHMREMGNFHHL